MLKLPDVGRYISCPVTNKYNTFRKKFVPAQKKLSTEILISIRKNDNQRRLANVKIVNFESLREKYMKQNFPVIICFVWGGNILNNYKFISKRFAATGRMVQQHAEYLES